MRPLELTAMLDCNREREFEEFQLGRSSVRRFLHSRDLFRAFLDPAKNAPTASEIDGELREEQHTAANLTTLQYVQRRWNTTAQRIHFIP